MANLAILVPILWLLAIVLLIVRRQSPISW